ncbi:hypothetical protein CYMTET_34589 [Cymbomonas tetramitiformis]|uniref:Uncharacterized protein n=1 Tax=Cymbomonas tetramitiformis TaxID=36881 RepID=A0AAE0FAS0_9CHLO|nr:hypothetical protein CYMTET_34589 [Cymbomonas tetramitiformis]
MPTLPPANWQMPPLALYKPRSADLAPLAPSRCAQILNASWAAHLEMKLSGDALLAPGNDVQLDVASTACFDCSRLALFGPSACPSSTRVVKRGKGEFCTSILGTKVPGPSPSPSPEGEHEPKRAGVKQPRMGTELSTGTN